MLKFRKYQNPHLNLVLTLISGDILWTVCQKHKWSHCIVVNTVVVPEVKVRVVSPLSGKPGNSLYFLFLKIGLFGSIQYSIVCTVHWLFRGMCRVQLVLCWQTLLCQVLPTKSRIIQTSGELSASLL